MESAEARSGDFMHRRNRDYCVDAYVLFLFDRQRALKTFFPSSVDSTSSVVDFPHSAGYRPSIRQAEQTDKKMRQPKLPEEAPSGIQAARHFPL
jgi:hypothetical protein